MGTHIPAQNEHTNIVNMPPTGRFEHGRAPRLVSSSRKGRDGAMRAPQGCASWPNLLECAISGRKLMYEAVRLHHWKKLACRRNVKFELPRFS